jgi:hypothetical protein
MTFIRQISPETLVLPRDLCKQNASFRRTIRQGQSSTEALIQHLETKGIKHSILKDPETRRLKGVFIACPESIEAQLEIDRVIDLIDSIDLVVDQEDPHFK